jgi:hypothetical protein
MVEKGSPGSLDDADAFSCDAAADGAVVSAEDFGIVRKLATLFGGVQAFDGPGPSPSDTFSRESGATRYSPLVMPSVRPSQPTFFR